MNNNNSLEKLYQRFGKEFCLCPFLGGFYQTNRVIQENSDQTTFNTIRPCSVVDFPDAACDITNNSIVDALNGPDWIRLRKAFLNGEFQSIPDCKNCSDAERLGAQSSRMGANQHFVHHSHVDLISAVERVIENDFKVDGVVSLDYYPSNYCNYSCVMCAGGASSSRLTFEIKVRRIKEKIVLNAPDADFYEVLKQVQILNFTGGETVMQQQVHDLIDYLIQEDLAKNITIFLLTNCSSYPEKLIEKFKQFYNVVYLCSIDGTERVIEYQRRGATWSEVEKNSLRLIHNDLISTVVNVVLTAINAPKIMDLVKWFHDNRVPNVVVTPVFRVDHLGVSTMPPPLRSLALERLKQGLNDYDNGDEWTQKNTVNLIKSLINMIELSPYREEHWQEFVTHIAQEDSASNLSLVEAVPEWAPYFN